MKLIQIRDFMWILSTKTIIHIEFSENFLKNVKNLPNLFQIQKFIVWYTQCHLANALEFKWIQYIFFLEYFYELKNENKISIQFYLQNEKKIGKKSDKLPEILTNSKLS